MLPVGFFRAPPSVWCELSRRSAPSASPAGCRRRSCWPSASTPSSARSTYVQRRPSGDRTDPAAGRAVRRGDPSGPPAGRTASRRNEPGRSSHAPPPRMPRLLAKESHNDLLLARLWGSVEIRSHAENNELADIARCVIVNISSIQSHRLGFCVDLKSNFQISKRNVKLLSIFLNCF